MTNTPQQNPRAPQRRASADSRRRSRPRSPRYAGGDLQNPRDYFHGDLGAVSPRRGFAAVGGNLHGTSEGVPGGCLANVGAGGDLAAEHAAQRGSEVVATCTAIAAPLALVLGCNLP